MGADAQNKPQKAPRLTREQSLSALPVRNTLITARVLENGETELTVPRRDDWLGNAIARLLFAPRTRRVVLDSIGSFIWELCDGEHDVRQITEALAAKYKLTHREAETSLTEYLRTLGRKRLIAFAIPKDVLEEGKAKVKSKK
jgi:hypothetical protein